jgi:hypothetical protein
VEGAAERERAHRSLAALAALKLAESRALARARLAELR